MKKKEEKVRDNVKKIKENKKDNNKSNDKNEQLEGVKWKIKKVEEKENKDDWKEKDKKHLFRKLVFPLVLVWLMVSSLVFFTQSSLWKEQFNKIKTSVLDLKNKVLWGESDDFNIEGSWSIILDQEEIDEEDNINVDNLEDSNWSVSEGVVENIPEEDINIPEEDIIEEDIEKIKRDKLIDFLKSKY